MNFRDLPKATQQIIIGTMLAAFAAMWVSVRFFEWDSINPWELLFAAILCSALSMVQIQLTAEKSRMSLSFAGLLGVAMLYGPAYAALIGLVEGGAGNLVVVDPKTGRQRLTRPDFVKLAFNAFNHSLSACLAGLVYVLFTNGQVGTGVFDRGDAVLPGLAATIVYFLVNTLDTAAVIATSKNTPLVKIWHDNFFWTAPQYLASASAVIACLWSLASDWKFRFAGILFLPVIYVVYYSYRLYMDKIHKDLEHIKALNELNNSVISSLATAIDAKDHYTNKHLSRVQTYALEMASYLGLSTEDCEAVRCGALVHDIGKLGVPEHILTKPGKLTHDEFKRMQQHVEIGAAILKPVNFPWPVVDVVMDHHERWDGLGYPRGLKAEEIYVGARIVTLADVFDALTSDRPYRKAMSIDEAMEHVKKESGTHFDPKAVEALVAVQARCEMIMSIMADGEPENLGSIAAQQKISEEVMQKIARANSEFYAMYDMSRTLRGPMPLDETLQAVIERIEKLVPFSTCCVYLENGTEDLKVHAVSGLYSEILMGMRVEVGEGLSGRVFKELEPIVNGAATLDVGRKIPPTETVELNSSLVVPLRANGHPMGTISVYHSSYNIYTQDHARLLGLIAEHAANGIDSARRLHQTEEMALTDPLTGLPNARSFNNWLTRRLEKSILTHEAFAVVLMDLDHYKLVNDTMGHLRGDEILKDVAQAMQSCVRTDDMLARYAGDEFVLVVPQTDGTHISHLVERLCESVECLRPGGALRLGVSVGYALYPDDGLNARDLIAIADSRMYEHKNQKRQNRQ